MTDFETPHGTDGWTVLLFEARRGGGVVLTKKSVSAQIIRREKRTLKKWYVGEAFQLTKPAPKLQIQVAQKVFLGVFAKDVNRPIIWDCSHARNFVPVRTEIIFYTMEGEACSFQEIVGGKCGFSSKDKEKSPKVISLLNCTNNIDKHKSALAFTDVQNEVELILARARLF